MIPLPEDMECVEIREPGGPEVLRSVRRPLPPVGADEVLVRVAAAGVNRPDSLQRRGHYPPPAGASDIPGLEIAGEIAAVGSAVTTLAVGDRVCALVSGGGYATYCVAPEPQCLPVPGSLDFIAAAGIPETFFTVWTNVFERGALKPGETLLVHGGSSGIGTTAIQLAHHLGARVAITAGSDEKCEACRKLGADIAINYKRDDFVEAVRDFTAGRGADVILDMVGGSYFERNIRAAAREGRIVSIAFLGGSRAEINFMDVMRKHLVLTGSTLRARAVEEKGRIAAAVRETVWPMIEDGRVRPVIHSTFALRDASKAHALLESGTHIGKIILTT